jgi:hypothetical protein
MSLDDTRKRVENLLPKDAKIVDMRRLRPDEIRFRHEERTKTSAMGGRIRDEIKRDLDALAGDKVKRNSDGSPVTSLAMAPPEPETANELDEYDLVDVLGANGARLVPKLYVSRNGEYRRVAWQDPDNISECIGTKRSRYGDAEASVWLYLSTEPPTQEETPPYPRQYAKDSPEWKERRRGQWIDCGAGRQIYRLGRFAAPKGIRLRSGMTRVFGNGETLNENIGGIMAHHAPDGVADELRRQGRLQTRLDQNGNPCEYAVFHGPKDRDRAIRDFNKRVADSPPVDGKRKYIRHGGND